VIVIFNKGSGEQKGSDDLRTALHAAGLEPRLLIAHSGHEVVRLAAEAAADPDPVVVAAGGDGTISTVAAALAGTGKTLGIIPRGTFNFFARRLRIPLELADAVETLANARTETIDLGEVNDRVFINNSSIGLYPAALREREEAYHKFGRNRLVAYLSGAVALLRQSGRHLHLRLKADGDALALRSQFVFVCTNRDQLDFYQIRGSECLDAGMLAVYTAPPLHWVQMIRLGARMILRRLDQAEEYVALCTGELDIETRRPRIEVAIDGERVTMQCPLRYRLRRNALRVLVPAEIPEAPDKSEPAKT
jgi:diacylglycerol kinase family enzyme